MRYLSEQEWVDALGHSKTDVLTGGFGFPVHYSPPENWDTGTQEISEHLIYFVVRGRCHAVLDGRKHPLAAGDLCWVAPGARFRFFSAGSGSPPALLRFRMAVTCGRSLLRLKWDWRIFRNAADTMEWTRALVSEPEGPGHFASRRMACAATLFSIAVFEGMRKASGDKGLPSSIRQNVTRHVLEHPEERMSPAALARVAGLSPDYFSRLFRKSFGVAPREWLLKQRLHHAAGLLSEPGWRVSEVAARLGYPDLYLFSRQFKKEFKVPPTVWKRSRAVE